MYAGPSLRSLGLSLVLHASVVAALINVPVPASAPPLVVADGARPTEIRIAGRLYYVSQINASVRPSPAPVAAEAGRASAPKLPYVPAPNLAVAPASPALPATPAPTPLPEPVRIQREQARAFIPPKLRPTPAATQTIIQPLSPPDVTPAPTPLPNFRITADVSQMRRIPKPFVAPGRVTPPTPPQSPNVETPAMVLVPTPPLPPGEPLTIFSLSDHPIPFTDKVVVPAGNIAQPSGPAAPEAAAGTSATAGATAGTAAGSSASAATGAANGASGRAAASTAPRSVNGAGNSPGTAPGSSSGSSATASTGSSANPSSGGTGNAAAGAGPSAGRGSVGNGAGAALTGGGKIGDPAAIVGGTSGANGSTPSNAPGTGNTPAGVAATGTNAPGSNVITRSPTGNFDAVVVQAAPADQYPESRGLLSGRPIYSVYIPVGSAREWTLFFCVPGEKPEASNGRVITLGPLGSPVKAPYPTKLVRPVIALPSWEKYVLVHGTVNKEGHFENLRVVRSIKPETDQALLLALGAWEFRAASREGASIAVEFLLSIPVKGL